MSEYTIQPQEIRCVNDFIKELENAKVNMNALLGNLKAMNIILKTENNQLSDECKSCLNFKAFINFWGPIYTDLKNETMRFS